MMYPGPRDPSNTSDQTQNSFQPKPQPTESSFIVFCRNLEIKAGKCSRHSTLISRKTCKHYCIDSVASPCSEPDKLNTLSESEQLGAYMPVKNSSPAKGVSHSDDLSKFVLEALITKMFYQGTCDFDFSRRLHYIDAIGLSGKANSCFILLFLVPQV